MRLQALLEKIARKEKGFESLSSFLDDFIPEKLLKSASLQKAFDITDGEMEAIYAEAYDLYEKDQYSDAADAFRWLVILNPFSHKFWMGWAASQQLLENYTKALHAYAAAALLSIDSPYPHFHAYECYRALGNDREAEKALIDAEEKARQSLKFHALKEEIASLRGVFSL